jgi:hypothetical protein
MIEIKLRVVRSISGEEVMVNAIARITGSVKMKKGENGNYGITGKEQINGTVFHNLKAGSGTMKFQKSER